MSQNTKTIQKEFDKLFIGGNWVTPASSEKDLVTTSLNGKETAKNNTENKTDA